MLVKLNILRIGIIQNRLHGIYEHRLDDRIIGEGRMNKVSIEVMSVNDVLAKCGIELINLHITGNHIMNRSAHLVGDKVPHKRGHRLDTLVVGYDRHDTINLSEDLGILLRKTMEIIDEAILGMGKNLMVNPGDKPVDNQVHKGLLSALKKILRYTILLGGHEGVNVRTIVHISLRLTPTTHDTVEEFGGLVEEELLKLGVIHRVRVVIGQLSKDRDIIGQIPIMNNLVSTVLIHLSHKIVHNLHLKLLINHGMPLLNELCIQMRKVIKGDIRILNKYEEVKIPLHKNLLIVLPMMEIALDAEFNQGLSSDVIANIL